MAGRTGNAEENAEANRKSSRVFCQRLALFGQSAALFLTWCDDGRVVRDSYLVPRMFAIVYEMSESDFLARILLSVPKLHPREKLPSIIELKGFGRGAEI
jgi:hypothetical protein